MTLVRDAGLAVVVLGAVLAAGWVTGTEIAPLALLTGGVGAIALEGFASTRAATVQRAWSRPAVRSLAVAAGIVAVAAAFLVAPERGLNVLAGGLLVYLGLVSLVALGILPPTTAWTGK